MVLQAGEEGDKTLGKEVQEVDQPYNKKENGRDKR